MAGVNFDSILELAEVKVSEYLEGALKEGRIDRQLYHEAKKNILPNLARWLKDPHIDKHLPHLKEGICRTITMKSQDGTDEEDEKKK